MPLEGIEENGRIPRAVLPDDIKNPGRWRYVPEGRIKPGNIFERFMVSSFIVPLFFHESDIGTGGGVAVTDIDFRGQRRREFGGIFLSYTTEGQQRYSVLWQKWLHHRELEQGGIAMEERSYVRARAGYERTLTRRFFGLGPDTEGDDETSYTDEVTGIRLLLQQSIPGPGDDIVYTAAMRAEHHNLSTGHVGGVPSMDEVFGLFFDRADDYDILWISAFIAHDTRDSQHLPYSGWMARAGIDAVPLQSNGNAAAIFSLAGSGVVRVPGLFHRGGDRNEENPPTDVVAGGVVLEWAEGELPFWALPSLGGKNTLRGYIENRFTGRFLWHASAEYRFWTLPRGFGVTETLRVERIGAALFYDIGTVADSPGEVWSADVHDSYGISFRFTLERTALFRADMGFSDEAVNFTFAYGLSF